ncbi:MAG: hypothetical protein J7L32_02965 [Thermoplasmata archaeon]|nr:hypothetical protein [Thermoplasmata archaeon]
MNRKILDILVCTLLIGTALSTVSANTTTDSISFNTTLLFGGRETQNFDEGSVYETYEGQHIEIEVTARWNPPDPERPICLWVDQETLPEGATVSPDPSEGYGETSCVLSWTPAVGQAGTYNITFYIGEDCYEPIGSHVITIIVHPAPTPGLRFSQVDFVFDEINVPDSSWGRLEVDVETFTEYQGLEQGYLNAYSDAGWVVQNLLVTPVDGVDSITTYFDLGVSEGTGVSTLSLYLEFTPEPVLEFYDGPRVSYPADTFYYNAEGFGPLISYVPPPMPTTIAFDPAGETSFFIKPMGLDENVQCADNQCAPMSIANSLQYLENRYGINVPHQHKKGLKGDNTLVGKLDSAMNRGVTARWDGDGVNLKHILEGKFKYLKDNGLANKLTHKHQGYGFGSIPAGDFTSSGITSKDESVNGKVTFDWICEEVKKCEDVEIGIAWPGGGGHFVRVIGCEKVKGVPRLWIAHDATQTYKNATGAVRGDDEGLEVVPATITDDDHDGVPDITYTSGGKTMSGEIVAAISESPRLPTWRYHFFFDECPGGWLEVYGTHNCDRLYPPLFSGYIKSCHTYTGYIPSKLGDYTINDLMFDFYWDYYCNNVDHIKLVYPKWNPLLNQWWLYPIKDTFNEYMGEGVTFPLLGDPYGELRETYVVVNLAEFLESPQPPQDMYEITDGCCEDLPGYLIGTTPIVFNPFAAPDENPFSTTPVNGVLFHDSEITAEPQEEVPCYPDVEITSGFQIGTVTATVTNENCSDITDVDWTISVDGSFVFMGGETNGVISSLPTGGHTTIQSNFIVGFGSATITVTVDDCEPVTANAFLLGPFIFVS